MAKKGGTRFTWVIKNFGSLVYESCYSDIFEIGTTGHTCRIGTAPIVMESKVLPLCIICQAYILQISIHGNTVTFKDQNLRNGCMSSLLALVATLCQSLQELSNKDLVEADIALKFVKEAGFKVDWLEKNLEQVKEKKKKELSGLAKLQQTEESLLKLKLKQKCAELEALAEEQKEELSATRTSLSFDDLIS
ncbi:hypothetical protein Rs2_18880 [Raphanus sativus]|uniref:MATH domain and coiled-coil domain-containing protein At3g58410-like n=1 Tax=Raphanus sativus TaxID=3726 RepID=A0A6J0N7M3_RAPSA|nr:MATH domain and coiled-coil domain-containing protein At3g58410-like [Raphanus sativus]KAJ4904929.1 hypothetical protein Rs2_18880 [Raphanus sativus]